jgi:hypothetical protein
MLDMMNLSLQQIPTRIHLQAVFLDLASGFSMRTRSSVVVAGAFWVRDGDTLQLRPCYSP